MERRKIMAENKILKGAVKGMDNQLKHMADALDEMEQYSGRDCLEIKGIPLDYQDKENTNDTIIKIGALMDLDISMSDISVSHPLPVSKKNKENPSYNPTIIVKFVRRDVKEANYKARK